MLIVYVCTSAQTIRIQKYTINVHLEKTGILHRNGNIVIGDEIFLNDGKGYSQSDNNHFSQWQKYCQNDNTSNSVFNPFLLVAINISTAFLINTLMPERNGCNFVDISSAV